MTVKKILKQYQKTERTPSGNRYQDEYRKLHILILNNQVELLEIMLDMKISNKVKMSLLTAFSSSGSVALKHNLHMIKFLKVLWERKDMLSKPLQEDLEWLERVHHYPLKTYDEKKTEVFY